VYRLCIIVYSLSRGIEEEVLRSSQSWLDVDDGQRNGACFNGADAARGKEGGEYHVITGADYAEVVLFSVKIFGKAGCSPTRAEDYDSGAASVERELGSCDV